MPPLTHGDAPATKDMGQTQGAIAYCDAILVKL